MKNIIFLIIAMIMMSAVNVSAQSKKELKAMAKRHEIIDATTDPKDGARWFMMDEKLTHIRAKVRDCNVSGTTATIKLLIYNFEPRDEILKFIGETYSRGYDDEGRYIHSNKVSFVVGDTGRFRNNLDNVLVPGGGAVLKVTMQIEDVNPNIKSFKEFRFGVTTELTGGYRTYSNYIYDLDIRR